MKKALTVMVVGALVFSLAPPVHADGPLKKLGRGMANVLTCPLEFPKALGEAHDEDGLFASFTWGVLAGTFNIVKRAAVGVYEIVTFPVPLPADYKPVLDDPEFFLEERPVERVDVHAHI